MEPTRHLEIMPAPKMVFARAEERGERVRFWRPLPTGGFEPVRWASFAADIEAVARWLIDEARLNPGEHAAVFASNSVEWAVAAFAIQAAGGVLVPVYPASTRDQARYILGHADAKVVFCGASMANIVTDVAPELPELRLVVQLPGHPAAAHSASEGATRAHAPRLVSYASAREAGARAEAAAPGRVQQRLLGLDLEAIGLMLYTSGTSGPPKGVPLSHRNIGVNARDWLLCNAALLEEGDRDVLWLPMSHIFGFGELCLGNTLGFETWLSEPSAVLTLLPEVAPQVFMSVPSHWEKLAHAGAGAGSADERRRALLRATGGRLRFCLSGGAGLKREIKERFHEAGMLIIEGYGLTETAPTLTLNRPEQYRFDSVGKALPSVELRLAEDGEILARGPNVFGGYHKAPEATAAAFTPDGWFKTGDVGRFTEDGFLQLIDRKKDILVTAGGKNVAPANIELRFRDAPLVAHAVVYGDARKYLVAGLWLEPSAERALREEGEDALAQAVHAAVERVNAELARYETIKRYRVMTRPLTVEEGFLTASLKVRRRAVYDAFRADFEAMYD